MDQIKIGKFIAEERKAKEYTQRELADKLSISDKTISKWERGNGFPEVSLLLPLCNELEITVNELLSGERLQEMDYKKKAEENMVNLVKEAQESKKKINSAGNLPLPVNRFNEHLKNYCREAGIRVFSSHKARFYVATSLFDVGLTDFQVACYLGHSEASTSHIYDRRSKEIKLDPAIIEECMGNIDARKLN